MKRPIAIMTIAIGLIAAAALAGWLYFRANPAAWDDFVAEMEGDTPASAPEPVKRDRPARGSDNLFASGTIEVEQIMIASELGGRVVEVLVDEGDRVAAGDVLLKLDSAAMQAQHQAARAAVAQAQAALDGTRAQLALAQSGARPEELALAASSVAAAEAGLRAAAAQRDAAAGQLAAARAQLQAAEAQLAAAEAQLETAEVAGVAAAVEMAEANVEMAQTGVEAAAALVSVAAAGLDGAEAGVAAAEAQLQQAELGRAIAEAGARPEELALLEANVRQTQAAVAGAQSALQASAIQLDRVTLTAPRDGVVVQRLVHAGELGLPGSPLLALADLSQLTLTVYVPEAELGRVALGQAVAVTVDAYDEVFAGRVTQIASQAEFTPRNVQTQEERVHMVFAVKITLDNAAGRLKPGMPADAQFQP